MQENNSFNLKEIQENKIQWLKSTCKRHKTKTLVPQILVFITIITFTSITKELSAYNFRFKFEFLLVARGNVTIMILI
jgi:hypothetical protein